MKGLKEKNKRNKGRRNGEKVTWLLVTLVSETSWNIVSPSFCMMNKGFPNDIGFLPRGRRPR